MHAVTEAVSWDRTGVPRLAWHAGIAARASTHPHLSQRLLGSLGPRRAVTGQGWRGRTDPPGRVRCGADPLAPPAGGQSAGPVSSAQQPRLSGGQHGMRAGGRGQHCAQCCTTACAASAPCRLRVLAGLSRRLCLLDPSAHSSRCMSVAASQLSCSVAQSCLAMLNTAILLWMSLGRLSPPGWYTRAAGPWPAGGSAEQLAAVGPAGPAEPAGAAEAAAAAVAAAVAAAAAAGLV